MLEALHLVQQENGPHPSRQALYGIIQRLFEESIAGLSAIFTDSSLHIVQSHGPLNLAPGLPQIPKAGIDCNAVHPADKGLSIAKPWKLGEYLDKAIYKNFKASLKKK